MITEIDAADAMMIAAMAKVTSPNEIEDAFHLIVDLKNLEQ